jgi:SAM-dependent methyltransferase
MSSKVILNLGKQPITNSYLKDLKKHTLKKEIFYNLEVTFNTKSYLISIKKKINPRLQYTSYYAHRASQSSTMLKSFKLLSKKIKKRFKPKKILEIGSNDGAFIKNFPKKNSLAVEPCLNLARITNKIGYKTYGQFWTKKLAIKISKKSKFCLIYSANTISHIPSLRETFDSVHLSLKKEGIFILEDPYMGSVIQNNSYDQFYDEHVYIFKILSLNNIIKESHLRIFDVELLKTHGGSMRYYICKNDSYYKQTDRFKQLRKKEILSKLNNILTYKKFSNRVKNSKNQLKKLLNNLKKRKKKIISYGATYKSTTIFNYCNIGPELIDYIVDTTKNKQNKYSPGKHIPIISPNKGFNNTVDYAFLGAWNFKNEILKKEKKYVDRGGRFITHVPYVQIIKK